MTTAICSLPNLPWAPSARPARAPLRASAAAPRAALWAELAVHAPELRGIARHICRDDAEREDLIQDTFERALRFLAAGNPRPANPCGWLISILRNAFIDRMRRAAISRVVLDGDAAERAAEPPPEAPWSAITVDEIRAALVEIEPAQRQVFELHYL